MGAGDVVELKGVKQGAHVRLHGLDALDELVGDLAIGRRDRERVARVGPAQREEHAALGRRDHGNRALL